MPELFSQCRRGTEERSSVPFLIIDFFVEIVKGKGYNDIDLL